MAVLASRSLAALNREGLSHHFPHKIDGRARGGNGPSLQQERQTKWCWSPGARCYLECSKKMLKRSPVLDMWYPKLCNCICLGSYRETQTILYLFSIGMVSQSPYLRLCCCQQDYPTPPVLLLSLKLVVSHCETETSIVILRLPPLLCILKVWWGFFLVCLFLFCFLINYSQFQFESNILLQN